MTYMRCPRCEWKLVRAEDDSADCTNSECTWPYAKQLVTDGVLIMEYINWLEAGFRAMQEAHNFKWSPRMYFEGIDLLSASIELDSEDWIITE